MRLYAILIVALGVLAAIMTLPGVGLVVLLATFGLGAPFVFSATGLVYSLCALPMVLLWRAGLAARVAGITTAALLVAGAVFGPAYFGLTQARKQAETYGSADKFHEATPLAATLEIRRPASSYDGTFAGQEACGEECRAVLSSGAVQWVRIVMSDDRGSRNDQTSTFFRALRGSDCAVPGSAPSDAARCVVIAADPGDKAELTIAFEAPKSAPEDAPAGRFATFEFSRAVSARLSRGELTSEVLRQTEVSFDVPIAPAIWGPRFTGMNSQGVGLVAGRQRFNPIMLASVLAKLGYANARPADGAPFNPTPADWRGSINDGMTREMIAVLDLPQTEPFNAQQMKPIFDWIMHARMLPEWTPDLIALVRRLVRDRRIRAPTFFDQIFERQPALAKALLPDVLDVIASEGIGRDYTPARQAAYTFARIDPELLKPYASRILGLLGHGREVKAILLPAIGRLGVDPLPYLTPFNDDINDPSPYSKSPRVIGACRAEKQWAGELIDALRQALRSLSSPEPEYRAIILKALENLGDHEFVERELTASADPDSVRLRARIENDAKRKDPAGWLCNWI
jgi:hypothetical protein